MSKVNVKSRGAVRSADLRINSQRMLANFEALTQIGANAEGGIDRLALSTADWQARIWLADRLDEAGLALVDDDAANLGGVLRSDTSAAKTLLIGSHLDTVPNGGRYDGSVGILAALECLHTIREAGIKLPVHLELINFTDDEGTWRSLFGVRALAGMLSKDEISDARLENAPFRAALARVGLELRDVSKARREPSTFAGYLELHIEHGTRLEKADTSIGVVTGIVGRTTYAIDFHGQAGHSGTTDMYKRRDALRGAALFIVRAHDMVRARYGDGIFSCGDVHVEPGKYNIIPSEAHLIAECRHVSEALLSEMETAIIQIARECAASYGLTVEIQPKIHMPAAAMAAGFMEAIEASCDSLDLTHTRLVSYAGHAAQIISQIAPCGMIFIPSLGGIGHSPLEFTPWDDIVDGTNVLLQTILRLAQSETSE